jgi:NADH dehydrogenase
MAKEKIVIIGGGFGGVKAALELSESDKFDITLISDRPDLRYYPTLYHTTTGGSKANSSIPLTRLFKNKPVKIVEAAAKLVDRRAKTVTLVNDTVIPYDSVILSLGVVTNYFGINGLAEFSYGIKSQEEAQRLKTHLHQQLIDGHAPDLNYVVIGAGPTGIELSGALPHYLKTIMKNHGITNKRIHIDLIEAAPRLLPRMPKDTSRLVKRQLKRLGVTLFVGQAVQGATAEDLTVNGKPIRSHTIIWTAGVTNHPFFKENAFALTTRGKVSVDAYLQAEDNVFVIGDNANTPFSGMAQTAIHDGDFVAHNLIRRAEGKSFKSYVVKKPITVIPAGEKWAIVLWGKVRLYGWLGYVLRELGDLVGFHDYEPWPKAVEQWLTEFDAQESCPTCLAATSAK